MASRKRKWLIDAHNVMHQLPEIKSRLQSDHLGAMRDFCMMVSTAARKNRCKAELVFDGVPLIIPGTFAGLTVHFSRERTADEVIISMLAGENAAQKWTLVTDDREIRQQAFYYHVDVLRTGPFISLLTKPAASSSQSGSGTLKTSPRKKNRKKAVRDPGEVANPDNKEVEFFLKYFKGENE